MLIKIAFLLASLVAFEAFSIDLQEFQILEYSSSKNSISLDRGELENIKGDMHAKFFYQTGAIDNPKIALIAEGRLVKSFPKKSYWYLTNIFQSKLIEREKVLVALTIDSARVGRVTNIKKRHVLFNGDDYESLDDFLSKNENTVPDKLIEELDNFESSDKLLNQEKKIESDVLVTSYESFRKNERNKIVDDKIVNVSERYYLGSKELEVLDIRNEEDKKILNSLADGLVKKYKNLKYGYRDLYKNQKKLATNRELNEKMTIESNYEEVREQRKIQDTIDPHAQAKFERDGENWSMDFDDKSLRKYFIRTGLEKEYRRRQLVMNELDGNELLFHYAGSVSDHTTDVDENHRNLGYSLGFGYDLHLSRTALRKKDWSLQFLYEIGVTDFNIGDRNGRGTETIFGGYLNYYFINNPLTLNDFIWLMGVGMKFGSVAMTNADISKEYTYQTLSLPCFQVMTKYRFQSGDVNEDTSNLGYSFNFGVNLDMKRYSVVDSLDDNINGKVNLVDIKYLVGLGVFF